MPEKKVTVLPDLKYYQKLCMLLERVEQESPCDPDITQDQIAAYKSLNHFKANNVPQSAFELVTSTTKEDTPIVNLKDVLRIRRAFRMENKISTRKKRQGGTTRQLQRRVCVLA